MRFIQKNLLSLLLVTLLIVLGMDSYFSSTNTWDLNRKIGWTWDIGLWISDSLLHSIALIVFIVSYWVLIRLGYSLNKYFSSLHFFIILLSCFFFNLQLLKLVSWVIFLFHLFFSVKNGKSFRKGNKPYDDKILDDLDGMS